MDTDTLVKDVILQMIKYFEKDVRRINHAMKVYSFAKTIGESASIGAEKKQILEVAAVLHDIGIKESERKYNSSSGTYQELEGPPIARELLADFKLEKEFMDRVCYLIGNHHSYGKIDDVDFQILVEADWLVNIFEDSLSESAISSVKKKYFKTNMGISLLECMFEVKR